VTISQHWAVTSWAGEVALDNKPTASWLQLHTSGTDTSVTSQKVYFPKKLNYSFKLHDTRISSGSNGVHRRHKDTREVSQSTGLHLCDLSWAQLTNPDRQTTTTTTENKEKVPKKQPLTLMNYGSSLSPAGSHQDNQAAQQEAPNQRQVSNWGQVWIIREDGNTHRKCRTEGKEKNRTTRQLTWRRINYERLLSYDDCVQIPVDVTPVETTVS